MPLQVAWRIWRTTAVAEATKAGRRRRRQLYAGLRAWQESAARTKAVMDRRLPLKLASRATAATGDKWISPCAQSAKAEATLMKHALDKLKVSEVTTKPLALCEP